jgi:hypothetical protein
VRYSLDRSGNNFEQECRTAGDLPLWLAHTKDNGNARI